MPGTSLPDPPTNHPCRQMVAPNGMYWLTVEEEPDHRDDFKTSHNEAKGSPVDSSTPPSRTSSSKTCQVPQKQKSTEFQATDLEIELNTFKFCMRLPFTHPPPNTSQICCLCEQHYYPQWCIRGPETSVMLPCGCLIGHYCAHHWFSKFSVGYQNCPTCNTLVVDGYGNAIRVDKPEQWTEDGESVVLSTTEDRPDARNTIDLAVPGNQQDRRAALPWNDDVTSEEVDDAVHRKLRRNPDQQKNGIINEEHDFAWLSLDDAAGHRPGDEDHDEPRRGRSRDSSANVTSASNAVAVCSNKKLSGGRSSGKAGPTKATRGLAKAVSAVNLLMRTY